MSDLVQRLSLSLAIAQLATDLAAQPAFLERILGPPLLSVDLRDTKQSLRLRATISDPPVDFKGLPVEIERAGRIPRNVEDTAEAIERPGFALTIGQLSTCHERIPQELASLPGIAESMAAEPVDEQTPGMRARLGSFGDRAPRQLARALRILQTDIPRYLRICP
jgi:hypothetical protein